MTSRRRALDLLDEADRLVFAWQKRQGLGINDLLQMSKDQIEDHRRKAAASGILIPRTEEGYLYHGTSAARAARIKTEGLQLDKPSGWIKTGHGLHVRGRVFFADTVHAALFYAESSSKARPGLLRVPEVALMDRQPDPRDMEGSFFVGRPVPATDIEIWSPKGWRAAAPALPEPDELQDFIEEDPHP